MSSNEFANRIFEIIFFFAFYLKANQSLVKLIFFFTFQKNYFSSTISGSDLNRFLTSGYLNNGDGYLQRGGVELKTPKSPHFHRPPNFSYSRNVPNYVTPHRSANRGLYSLLFLSFSSLRKYKLRGNLFNFILLFICKIKRSYASPYM